MVDYGARRRSVFVETSARGASSTLPPGVWVDERSEIHHNELQSSAAQTAIKAILRPDYLTLSGSGVGKDGAGHVADEERYWSCETLTSS